MELPSAKNSANSVCESCGEEFSCAVETGNCWCFEVEVAEKTLDEIKQNFKKCLCRNCLIAYNKKQTFSE